MEPGPWIRFQHLIIGEKVRGLPGKNPDQRGRDSKSKVSKECGGRWKSFLVAHLTFCPFVPSSLLRPQSKPSISNFLYDSSTQIPSMGLY